MIADRLLTFVKRFLPRAVETLPETEDKPLTKHQEIFAGEQAKRALEDPVLIKAFKDVRLRLLFEIESAPIRDNDGIMLLRLQLKSLQDVRANLERAVQDGNVARIRVKEIRDAG